MNTYVNPGSIQQLPTASTLRRLLWVTPLAMVVATIANIVLYAVVAAIVPEVGTWPGAGVGQIAGATVGYLFFGAVSAALIARLSSRPQRHFLIVAVAGLVLSMALPISAGFGYGAPGAPPASVATVVTLALMHVVSFAISVPLFVRRVLD
jgi:hypothetical protein